MKKKFLWRTRTTRRMKNERIINWEKWMKNEKSKFLIYEKSTKETVDNKKKFSIKNYCKPSASLTTNTVKVMNCNIMDHEKN